MNKLYRIITAVILAFSVLGFTAHSHAADVEKRGQAYVIYLPAELRFSEVVERVQTEILAHNWEIVHVQNIDTGLLKLGVVTENKVIQACKSQYLKQAIQDDPFVTLIIPCRFTVFREHVPTGSGGDYEKAPARIVVGFSDPVAEAKALNIKNRKAAEVAAEELKSVLRAVQDYYKK